MAPSILFGCASIGGKFTTLESVQSLLKTLSSLNITHLDTAARYGANSSGDSTVGGIGQSEILLGQANVAQHGFTIDSKILVLGNGEPEVTAEKVEASTLMTLQRLKVFKVHTLYIHAPDPLTSLAEQAAAMNAQYRAGRMEKLGISNFSTEMLRDFIRICKEKGHVLPSVYQGQYNLLNREKEETLFPLLRQEGIRFVAYSPLASGFLTVGEGKKGNALLDKMYGDERIGIAVENFKRTLRPLGVSATEAALRWIVYHSTLRDEDAVILGASREEQVVDSMEIVKRGPLEEEVVKAVEQVWEAVRQE